MRIWGGLSEDNAFELGRGDPHRAADLCAYTTVWVCVCVWGGSNRPQEGAKALRLDRAGLLQEQPGRLAWLEPGAWGQAGSGCP